MPIATYQKDDDDQRHASTAERIGDSARLAAVGDDIMPR